MRHRRRLGEAVAFEDLPAGELLEPLHDLDRERRGPRHEPLNGSQVVLSEVTRLVEENVDPRGAREESRPTLLYRKEDVLQIGTRDEDHRHRPEGREV